MLSLAEISHAIYGAWRLALLDANGLKRFDNTIEAYWQSFQAAIVTAPAYVILVGIRLAVTETEAGLLQIVLVEAISYTISWVAFPLAMSYVCNQIGCFDRYVRYIIAHNWSAVIQIAIFLSAMTLARSILGAGTGTMLLIASSLAILCYQWFVARTALAVSGGVAAAIVGLDLVISIVLNAVSGRFI